MQNAIIVCKEITTENNQVLLKVIVNATIF